jgi:ribose 5-phosphate isomerase B
MKVALGNDHAGIEQRAAVIKVLQELGHQVLDFGTSTPDAVDYPDIAEQVARAVLNNEADRGILLCGTGIGMSIAANKFPGIRCSCCTDEYAAKMARAHNNANVLALRSREIESSMNEEIIRTWFTTDFEGGRHTKRVDKISKLEETIARKICSQD